MDYLISREILRQYNIQAMQWTLLFAFIKLHKEHYAAKVEEKDLKICILGVSVNAFKPT